MCDDVMNCNDGQTMSVSTYTCSSLFLILSLDISAYFCLHVFFAQTQISLEIAVLQKRNQ